LQYARATSPGGSTLESSVRALRHYRECRRAGTHDSIRPPSGLVTPLKSPVPSIPAVSSATSATSLRRRAGMVSRSRTGKMGTRTPTRRADETLGDQMGGRGERAGENVLRRCAQL